MTALVCVLVALVAIGLYLSWLAGRLDRLHTRVDSAWASLDAQLLRRAVVTAEVASSGLLDPASAMLLIGAAREARDAPPERRELAESDLTRALRASFDMPRQVEALAATPDGSELVTDLETAVRRVQLSRRFHNEAVVATRMLRRRRLVRYGKLAGHAAMPMSFEMDDDPPRALLRDGAS